MSTNINIAGLDLMTIGQLTSIYNAHASSVGVTTVKKFSTKADAVKRVLKLVEQLNAMKPKQTEKSRKIRTERTDTMTYRIETLIRAGRTNREIQDELDLPANKAHYPSWYRARMKRSAS